MNRTKNICLIASAITVAVGICISIFVCIITNFNPYKNAEVKFDEKVHLIDEKFENIKIDDTMCNIFIIPSEDEECKVVCHDEEKRYHTVEVVNNTLTINSVDSRKWYEEFYFGFTFSWNDFISLSIYLPEKEYKELYIDTFSGDVDIASSFTFANSEVESTSGDIKCNAKFKGDVKFDSTSGDIDLSNVSANNISACTTSGDIAISDISADNISADTTSGEVEISSVNAKDKLYADSTSGDVNVLDSKAYDIFLESTSGDVDMRNTVSLGDLKIESTSGDIEFYRCDGKSIDLNSVSGDIEGSFLTEKLFITDTTSGEVNVPNCTSDEQCRITTTSGDIEVTILKY